MPSSARRFFKPVFIFSSSNAGQVLETNALVQPRKTSVIVPFTAERVHVGDYGSTGRNFTLRVPLFVHPFHLAYMHTYMSNNTNIN